MSRYYRQPVSSRIERVKALLRDIGVDNYTMRFVYSRCCAALLRLIIYQTQYCVRPNKRNICVVDYRTGEFEFFHSPISAAELEVLPHKYVVSNLS